MLEGTEVNKIIFQWHFVLGSLFTGIAQEITAAVFSPS